MRSGKWHWMMLWVVMTLMPAAPSSAVVLAGGDGTGNTTDPGTGLAWANVGYLNGGGGVYLGGGWVLTANHIGVGDPIFPDQGGTTYLSSGNSYRIHDPSNPSLNTDLVMFQLQTYPAGLPALRISQTQPSYTYPNYSPITAIGYGVNRLPTETWWNSSWGEQTGSPYYYGFHLPTTNVILAKRWGTNNLIGTWTGDDGTGTTNRGLYCDFTRGGSPNEMQVVSHDSGGGVFYKNGNNWELTGIILGEGRYTNQPDFTVVYNEMSAFADLSQYYSQITAKIISTALSGDANLDGRVDINDLTTVLTNYDHFSGMTRLQGDVNSDNRVDINDLTIVLANYNTSLQSAAGGDQTAVPEPSTTILLAAFLPVIAWAIGRRRAARK
jgi:hypothetical protein